MGMCTYSLTGASVRHHVVAKLTFLGLCVAGLMLSAGACSRDQNATEAGSSARQPSFLLYISDTLRADALSCYGNTTNKTPVLDSLAAKGVLFERAIAPSSWTRASMTSILTGLYPTAHKTVHRLDQIPSDIPRLADSLRRKGYRTAFFTTNPNTASVFGFRPGFDFFEDFGASDEIRTVRSNELSVPSDELHESIKQWLSTLDRDQPFLIVALAIDPHAPYDPPKEFDRFGDPNYSGRIQAGSGPKVLRKIKRPADKERLRSLYYGEIAFNDYTLGQLLDHLESIGRAKDTVIAYTSDHGEEFWDHGSRGHGHTLYAESVGVPLIWFDPDRRERGVRVSRPVTTLDIMPTILATAGIELPNWVQGRSLFEAASESQAVYSELDLDGRVSWAVYDYPWKLIRKQVTMDDVVTIEEYLFNMADDPAQQQNLSTAQPDVGARLRLLLETHIAESTKHGESISSGRVTLDQHDIPEHMQQHLRDLGYAGDDDEEEEEAEEEDHDHDHDHDSHSDRGAGK